ncbi:hypothetical protein CDCA_CDCA04G1395 [Cyanidium caldarium]|uniref:nucleoside-diphosphate kinase n=1 Tax=Cyanidium caldarium TaxID=2771 RepID=A0AAV9ISU7_CYACA|nr:hypothetical protein CDCA_CDCA04G1395 [Cyanidium caldarium]
MFVGTLAPPSRRHHPHNTIHPALSPCRPPLTHPLRSHRAPRPCRALPLTCRVERTFTAIKPDAVNRGLIGEIITRFERKGYKLVGLKLVRPTQPLAETHYAELASKPFYPSLVQFLCSGPVVAMCWEGKDVVRTARKMLGATNPLESDPSTIRGAYAIDVGRNVVHSSDAVSTAEREIALWFRPEELVEWAPTSLQWIYE